MSDSPTLDDNTLHRLLDSIAPDWTLRDATPAHAEAAQNRVYRLALDTPAGDRTCYLKAPLENDESSVALEARLLALLDDKPTIPTPRFVGTIDQHPDGPTPAVLMGALPGNTTSRLATDRFTPETHRALAHQIGRHLHALHQLDVVDAYGFLEPLGTLDGNRPDRPSELVAVREPAPDWRSCLHQWADETVAGFADGRFADLEDYLWTSLAAYIDDLDGPFRPVFARIDQSLENTLVEEGVLTGMVDWEFTIAATPGYDLATVAQSLAGGPFRYAPPVTDRYETVLAGVLAGYREAGGGAVADQVRENRACYDLLFAARTMAALDDWYGMLNLDEHADAAAARLRTEVTEP